MSEESNESLGYVKYVGSAVDEGLMDAGKSADALAGFNEVLRYLMYKKDPSLRRFDFEFPVRVNKGSWEIEVPQNITNLITLAGGVTLLTAYLTSMAKKAGSDGLFETGLAKDLGKTVSFALKAFRKIIEIAKYCGRLGQKEHENVRILEDGTVEIAREDLPHLIIDYAYYKLYADAPAKLTGTSRRKSLI